jgi:hypothetical protein
MHSSDSAVKTILIERSRLRATLSANLEIHKKEYAEAKAGYEEKRLDLIRKLAEAALHCSKKPNNTDENRKAVHESYNEFARLEKPQNHSNEYEQAIALMEWETREKIDISISDFERFVRDDWAWKNSFKNAHLSYTTPNS